VTHVGTGNSLLDKEQEVDGIPEFIAAAHRE